MLCLYLHTSPTPLQNSTFHALVPAHNCRDGKSAGISFLRGGLRQSYGTPPRARNGSTSPPRDHLRRVVTLHRNLRRRNCHSLQATKVDDRCLDKGLGIVEGYKTILKLLCILF